MGARSVSVLLLAACAATATAAESPTLRFLRPGAAPVTLTAGELAQRCGAETVQLDDPYYGARKSYRACPLAAVLALGFGAPIGDFAGQTVFFRARDGYAKPAPAALLAEPGGFVAFADADHARGDDPGWQPIDRKQADPGPFYVVWTGAAQQDTHRYPWPYQLTEIEIAPIEKLYPHIEPTGLPATAPGRAGYKIFTSQCIACHAINREGGTVGPDLNVPRSIVEYRPAEQIKAYVRDPLSFRYTNMPPHPALSDADLEALVAYFTAMKDRKHDPGQTP
jgi:mono/diheme cytochrome c family protein